jgi:hypothetical protein
MTDAASMSGFLIKAVRVKVLETKQFGNKEKYKNPTTGNDDFSERPTAADDSRRY